MTPRELFIQKAFAELGQAYRYGGNGPDYYDCSGYVLACLRAAGMIIEDMRAINLADKFRSCVIDYSKTIPGCLLFYGRPIVNHVMLCLRRWPDGHFVLAGAHGGDEATIDYEIAYTQKAIVGIVIGNYWLSNLNFVADPFKEV